MREKHQPLYGRSSLEGGENNVNRQLSFSSRSPAGSRGGSRPTSHTGNSF